MKKISILATLVALMSSCVSIDYLGKNYNPTYEVELYFNQNDIQNDYQVMGMMNADAPEIISSQRIQQRMIEKAREVGADAVLFEFQDRKVSATNTNTNRDRYGEFSTTTVSENKIVSAKLIKFNRG